MEYSNHFQFEDVVQADPTLRFFLREAVLDYDKLEFQTKVVGNAIVLAINDYINLKYR